MRIRQFADLFGGFPVNPSMEMVESMMKSGVRNKRIIFFAVILSAFVGLTALAPFSVDSQSSSVSLTKAQRDYLAGKDEIVFVSQSHYPPFEFVDEQGSRRGMMIELAQWLSSELGFHARFVDTDFLQAQAAIQSGEADVLTSFFYSDKRDETFDFTQTVFEVPASIFVAANRPDITSVKDLEGKKIAMQRGDYAADFLKDRQVSFEKVPTRNFAEAVVAVAGGQADALIGDEQIVLYFLYSNNLYQELKIVGEPLYVGLNSMAVVDGNSHLQAILNQGIDHARAGGMLDRLNRKWVGTSLPNPEAHVDWQDLWPYILALLGVLIGILIWNIQLRRVVAARTAELRHSERRLTSVIDGTQAGAWEWNIVTGATFYNRRWAGMLGYDLAELGPTTHEIWRKLVHPEDLGRAEDQLRRHCAGELPEYRCEIRMRHKQGSWVWVLDRGSICERAPDGTPLLMAGTHVDISERKQTEETLQRSEARNRALLQAIPDLIFLLNDQGQLVDYHAADPGKLMLPPEQFINRSLRELLPCAIADEALACAAAARKTGEAAIHEYQLDLPEGVRWFESRIVPCGENMCLAIVRDVTVGKKLEQSLSDAVENQQILLDNIKTQVWYLTGEHRYGAVNQAHADFFGVTKKDLAFKDLYDFMPAEAVAVCRVSNGQVFRTGEATLTEEEVADGSGNRRLLQIHKFPKLGGDGRVEYVVCSAEDITERKAAETALKKKTQEMEDFVYSVSHDLKSPVVTIKTFLGMLQQDLKANNTELIEADLRFIRGGADKLETLLNALLRLSRAGNSAIAPVTVPVRQLVDEAVTGLAGLLQGDRIELEVAELPEPLHGDPIALGQIWQNLIENAVKYRGGQSQLKISIGMLEQEEGPVFYVQDNGAGIRAEDQYRIFGIFTQLNRDSEGSGLGLALVKKIVTLYQGKVWVDSAGEGQGSCFYFTLPGALVCS